MRSRLLARVLTAFAALLIAAPAVAYDATKAARYASPDMYRPNVDRLIINGSGITCTNPAGCDGSGLSVTPPGGTVSMLLSTVLGNVRSAESFNAKGDGTTDDTAAFAAISAWMGAAPGRGVVGRTGAVYMVTNWVWPFQNNNSFTCPAVCTVQALSGGDSDYLVATSRYVSNTGYLDYPVYTRNVVFDAAGIKAKAFVSQTYFARFERSMANNATMDGWALPAATRNGTAISGTGVENKWLESGATGNGRHGLNNGAFTDGQIIGGDWHDNGGSTNTAGYNINLNQGAGWIITYTHTYGVTALAGSLDIYVANWGVNSIASNNIIEGVATVASLGTGNVGTFGPGNVISGGLNAQIGNSGTTTLTSLANVYKSNSGQIRHQYFGADHLVRSVSDQFDTSTPFTWNNSGSTGMIKAERSWSQGLLGTLDGLYGVNTPLVIGRVNIPLSTPSSSSAACTVGDRAADANYEYVCTAANTWKRAALSPF
jgi:hypothetical protein